MAVLFVVFECSVFRSLLIPLFCQYLFLISPCLGASGRLSFVIEAFSWVSSHDLPSVLEILTKHYRYRNSWHKQTIYKQQSANE